MAKKSIYQVLRIKPEHSPPDLGQGWGPGVLATQEVIFHKYDKDNEYVNAVGILDASEALIKKFIEVQSLEKKLVPAKKFRFFYHYNKANKKMTIHFKKECIVVRDVICTVPCETHYNKIQPHLVLRGWALDVQIEGDKAIII